MSNSLKFEGRLHVKMDTEIKGETFSVREFVLHNPSDEYPQFVKFQLTQDRCEKLDPIEVGSKVIVHFDLRGREWEGKFFTNLNAWRIELAGHPDSGGGDAAPEAKSTDKVEDDLPF